MQIQQFLHIAQVAVALFMVVVAVAIFCQNKKPLTRGQWLSAGILIGFSGYFFGRGFGWW